LIGSGALDSLGKRETLFNLIEASLKRAEQSVERSESQISDLFSEDLHQEKDMNFQSKTQEEFDILSNEWSSLGFYLESHPIEGKREEVRKMCGLFISELEEAPHTQRVAGMLMHLNVRQGRHGRYAFVTIDDSSGRLEVSVWSEAFDTYRSVLRKGQIIVVEGVVEKDSYSNDKNNPSFKMIAERVFSFDQARKEFIKFVTISVGSDFKELDSLTSQLKELSTNGSGSPIVISYSGNNAKADIQLPKELTVEVSDLSYRTLESICGKGNVDLVYYARPYIH
jgi:DNA polymerase-3 subunit alpha